MTASGKVCDKIVNYQFLKWQTFSTIMKKQYLVHRKIGVV